MCATIFTDVRFLRQLNISRWFSPDQSISHSEGMGALDATIEGLSDVLLAQLGPFVQVMGIFKEIVREMVVVHIIIQMSVRQYELQSITKNLENKIILLKEQHKIMSERYEYRMKELSEQYQSVLLDKEQTIQFLKAELAKDKELLVYEQSIYDSHKLAEQNDILKQLEKYIKKCNELERKVQSMTEKYELKRKELEEQNYRLRQECQDFNTSRSNIQQELDKLNRFYLNAKIQQPKRQQTLELVDKLTDFIIRFEQDNNKNTKQSANFLKSSLESLKQDLLGPMKTLTDQDELLFKERKNILNKIGQIIEFQNKITKQSTEENQKLWEMMKKERNNQQVQKINELEKQLANRAQKNQNQTTQLTSRIKQLQNQRKTLLLGFTQLKALNQTREKSYREEIAVLKKSMEQILIAIEDREGQFQNQIQTLHGQLSHLNQRYYQNIEVPLNKLSGKLEIEIKSARKEIENLTGNKQFGRLVQNLELTLQKYVKQNQFPQNLADKMHFYSNKSQELAILCRQTLDLQNQRKLIETDGNVQLGMLMNEMKLRQVEWVEKQNKLNYELTTLKKQNKRLKQIYDQQSKDLRSTSNLKRTCSRSTHPEPANVKLAELELQNESLKHSNQIYQQKFMVELEQIRRSVTPLTNKSGRDNFKSKIHEGIFSIKAFNDQITNFLDEQHNHYRSVQDTIHAIDRILVKPIEVFDQFVEKVAKCYPAWSHKPVTNMSSNNSFVPLQKLQSFYEEITIKRQNNALSTNRLFTELIRTLRQSMSTNSKSRPLLQTQKVEQAHQKSKLSKDSPLQKKVKQLQTQKIKNRQQILRKLQKLQEAMKTMETKIGKRNWTPAHRLEELLERKIIEISEIYMSKTMDSSEQLTQITTSTLKQLRTKLKNCMLENEGLIKEFDCMQKLKKSA